VIADDAGQRREAHGVDLNEIAGALFRDRYAFGFALRVGPGMAGMRRRTHSLRLDEQPTLTQMPQNPPDH
jgi:hypothetical protein